MGRLSLPARFPPMSELSQSMSSSQFDLLAESAVEGFYSGISGDRFGVRALVSTRPHEGTVGGINRRTWTFWRNVFLRRTPDVEVEATMEFVLNRLTYGERRPDIILVSKYHWRRCREFCLPWKGDDLLLATGHSVLDFKGVRLVLDEFAEPMAHGDEIVIPSMVFLNCRYLRLRPHQHREFTEVPYNPPARGDGGVKPYEELKEDHGLFWAGALTSSCSYVHGALLL